MRKIIYASVFLVLAAAVIIQARRIKRFERADIVSIQSEWEQHGMPVDAAELRKGAIVIREKVSGVITQERIITADVPFEIYDQLKDGQQFIACKNNKDFTGHVSYVSEARDVISGLFRVRMRIETDVSLPAGTIVVCCVEIRRDTGVLKIPKTAVYTEDGKTYCWIVRDNTVHKKHISIISPNDHYFRVDAGLEEGAIVITDGMRLLKEDVRVRIRHMNGERS